jgi:membrane-associated protease RseP (regulator of RpoE activity)
MRGCITLKRSRILGARLHIHWSAFVAAGILFGALIRQPIHAFVAVLSYFAVILLHEVGHALFAKQLGYSPVSIYLTFIHGLCEFEHPDTLKEHATIAWGGVFAQLAVAIPLIVLSQTTPLGSISLFAIVIAVLGYLSMFVAFINLAPAKGLDGTLAWRLFPIIFREVRDGAAAKKAAKDVIRRLK